ncbi:glycosyltransferase family 2 protein [Variovorax ginsengisoli]|uniref:Rhamnosyltransferase n=1 Tax=Variovorax ginsengisoli TaxID=363844 RepID=A0ABT9SB44_9BURK|nr:glycosyltransferase family 2 protein [Variovorax ginsengisoli]MDP9901573.1 rhamnosyltransferase [Variovorax ginsengisoli]
MSPATPPHPAPDVCAVVITYRPQVDLLQQVIEGVQSQVGRLLVFDNGTQDEKLDAYFVQLQRTSEVVIERSPGNIGLAAAMNRAAEHARIHGFNHLLLLDQDSLPDPDMVATLKAALEQLQRSGPVAAVGPQFRDRRTGYIAPFIRVAFPSSQKLNGGPGQQVRCDFLISSGSLIPLESFDRVGPMDEGLFIDNVDLEWCFRARHRGFSLFGICDAQMRHSIGDALRPSRIVAGGIKIHSPVRLYYITRNRVLLYGRKETPAVWIAQDIPRLILKFFGTLLFLKPRAAYFRSMARGLRDALRGTTGPMGPS